MRPYARVYHMLESLQYGFLYFVATFIGAIFLDSRFPVPSEEKPTHEIFREIILQAMAIVVVTYFIRYIVKNIPLVYPVFPGSKYIPYRTPEYQGEVMMGLIFVGGQVNLIRKIDILTNRSRAYFFGKGGAKDD